MEPIGVGILGVAHGHVNSYCTKWLEQAELGIKVITAWDHDATRAQGFCNNHSLEQAVSVQAVLARADVAAVVIASETSLHCELVEQAAAAGKAIIVQKPIALELAQADRVVAAVKKANVPFTMAWQMRVDPHNLELKSLLDSGKFGRQFMVRRRHGLSTQKMKDFVKTWHVDAKYNRDIFADDAAHAIDFIYWLKGMPVSVVAELGTLLNPAIPNDNGIALFRYADGSFAEVSCSFVTVAAENVTEVLCEKGTIVQNYGDNPSCATPWPVGAAQLKWTFDGSGQWTVSTLPDIKAHGERIQGLAKPLSEFLRGKRPPIATAEEGRAVLRLVLACYESSASGRRISFK